MNAEKPMKILNFPASRPRRPRVAEHLASVKTLLSECLERQSALREDGRRLQASLARLTVLTRDMVSRTARLRRTLGRLRDCRGRDNPPTARV
ncbi:MAG: hypothetical protein AUI47_12150 [Acidobacteria bacterium 13_1_40CM_2_68_5]|nr:MAG: hypothetical protein AUI47_12150 [Acidobacteria bacterium 13_1_40CM_2_68_5]